MNYANKKNYLPVFFSGIMIGFSILLLTYAQEPEVTIPTTSHYSVSTAWAIETGETSITKQHTAPTTNPTEPTRTRQSESTTNKWSEKTDQGQLQPILRVKGFPLDSDATKIVNYAYKISWWDMEFIRTLKAENWAFDIHLQSRVPDSKWPNGREDSRGLCQLHRTRHRDVVDVEEFWESWEYQVEVCWQKYKWWTKFYGRNVAYKYNDHFYWE